MQEGMPDARGNGGSNMSEGGQRRRDGLRLQPVGHPPTALRGLQIRIRRGLRRYLPLELAGTALALAAAGLAHALTGEIALVALAATLGENLGYYGLATLRELRDGLRRRELPGGRRKHLALGAGVGRRLALEFGPAELLDSLWVRPASILLASRFIEPLGLAVLAGKLAADLIFYSLALIGHELEERRRAAQTIQEPSKP